MPTSSNTDPLADESGIFEEGVCSLCGGEPICGGLGYVRVDLPVGHPQFGQLFRCPQYQGAASHRIETLRKLGNLEAFADKTFDNFDTSPPGLNTREQGSLDYALRRSLQYAQNLDGWLLLQGMYGCGKTHLAAAIANARLQQDEQVLFITAPDLLDHLRNTYSPSSEVGYDELFDRVKNAPLLVLDDLGVENPSAWAQEKLFQLLNHRYAHRMPTVITTNAELEALDARIRSRLLDDTVIHHVKIEAPDYRTPYRAARADFVDLTMYKDMTFQSFDVGQNLVPDDRRNLEKAFAIASAYAAQPSGWLMLMGSYATGKTHLAAAIANALNERGEQVLFVTVPDLLDYLRVAYDPNTRGGFDRRFQTVRNARVLILDDLGTESATPWAKEKLFQVLNHRYVANLPTVITTAKEFNDLDQRVQSRLYDERRCTIFAITAPGYTQRTYRPRR